MLGMTMLSRRSFLAASAGAALGSARAAEQPKNLLFIASDDLNRCLSCYGHPLVKTPNIDRIAKAGVRFDRAYCQFPLCSPSRTSLMTGLAPDTTTVYDLRKHFREVIPDVTTLGELFQKNGYFAGRVGKIYHYGVPGQIGTAGLDDAQSWNATVNPNGIDHTKEEPLLTNYTPQRGLGSAVCFYASPAKDEEHTDGIVAAETVRLLEEHRHDKFFIAAGFYRPHVPWIAPAKYFDLFPMSSIKATPFSEDEMKIAPPLAYFTKPANWGMTEQQRREAIQAYFASIAFLDVQVGKLLDALERLKLAETTTIVFWSDHGYQLGEHGQWMKQTLFEASAKVPMLIGGAGVAARGKASGRTVELLDIYPTVAAHCGLKGTPESLHGKSLQPLLNRPDAAWTKPAITQTYRPGNIMGYSLRDERYRYTFWDRGAQGEELYDYKSDPKELQNLARNGASDGLKQQMKSQLLSILEKRASRHA
jgi:uncharacterized sulfatase